MRSTPVRSTLATALKQAMTIDLTMASADDILLEGLNLAGLPENKAMRLVKKRQKQLFRSNFGVGPEAAKACFDDLELDGRIAMLSSQKFLITLFWLRVCLTEDQMHCKFDQNPETMRNCINDHVEAIAALKELKIVWIDLTELEEVCVLSVDGVHFRMHEERTDPDARWCSHKFNAAGLGCTIALYIWRNQVAWVSRPFKAATHDKTDCESEDGLQSFMPPGKLVVADRGCRGEECDDDEGQHRTLSIRNTCDTEEVKQFKRTVRARHENFNARLEVFNVLEHRFRHGVERHENCMLACTVLCQCDMENGNPPPDA